MKLLNSQELKSLIKSNKITISEDTLYLDDNYIDKDTFVRSLKNIIDSTKVNMEVDDFGEYRKGNGQKSKNKRRKSK